MKILKRVFGLFIFVMGSLFAEEKKATSVQKLYNLLAKAPYSLVVFYDRSKSEVRYNKQNIIDMEKMLHALDKSPFYKGTDLHIIKVDISRGNFDHVLANYHIEIMPTFMTFIGRKVVGHYVTGFVYRPEIMTLIETNLKKEMTLYLKAQEAQRQRELEKARIQAYNNAYLWGPYWGPYWYGGYYPYWRGPYFNVGWW